MNTIANTASAPAAVLEAPKVETTAKQVEQVEVKPSILKVLGSKIEIPLLEKAIQDLHSDAQRVAKLAMENGYGRDIKSIAGTALKVVNLPAVRAMAKDGLLGDKDKTAARVANIMALNQFIDSLQAFGLMRRTVEK
jgi:hypothetical protein